MYQDSSNIRGIARSKFRCHTGNQQVTDGEGRNGNRGNGDKDEGNFKCSNQ